MTQAAIEKATIAEALYKNGSIPVCPASTILAGLTTITLAGFS
jgi:hypothetical protein